MYGTFTTANASRTGQSRRHRTGRRTTGRRRTRGRWTSRRTGRSTRQLNLRWHFFRFLYTVLCCIFSYLEENGGKFDGAALRIFFPGFPLNPTRERVFSFCKNKEELRILTKQSSYFWTCVYFFVEMVWGYNHAICICTFLSKSTPKQQIETDDIILLLTLFNGFNGLLIIYCSIILKTMSDAQ